MKRRQLGQDVYRRVYKYMSLTVLLFNCFYLQAESLIILHHQEPLSCRILITVNLLQQQRVISIVKNIIC